MGVWGLHGGKCCTPVWLYRLLGDFWAFHLIVPPPLAPHPLCTHPPDLLTSYIPWLSGARGMHNYDCEILSSKWSISCSHISPELCWRESVFLSLLEAGGSELSLCSLTSSALMEMFCRFVWHNLKFLGPNSQCCPQVHCMNVCVWMGEWQKTLL